MAACSRLLAGAEEARRNPRHRAEEEAEGAAGTRRRGAAAGAVAARSRRLAAGAEGAEASTLPRAAVGAVVAGPTFPSSFTTLQIRTWQPTQSFGSPRPASPARM